MIVPQANDIDKILDLPLAVADGANTKYRIIKRYDFDGRQADYYIEALGGLGLLKSESGMYSLTDEGRKYRRLDPLQQKLMIIRKMVALPIIAIVLGELIANDRRVISKDEIESLIKENTPIRGTTVPRRAECLFKWLGWIGDETGVLSIEGEVIRLRIAEKSIP
ncbi:MAG: AAA-associated domain-containing protein [Nitrososphaerota archaeon]|nr:AAA-associated domain-containing protein [Nitrososphaerota archaeon]